MKMLPVQLSLNPPLGLWSDMLWRCPPAPPSHLAELKTQLPPSLPSDPRLWSREDVSVFLHFCEREFDLPKVDYDLFQMNGKALCLLTRSDFGHRCPGAGDVLHNVLQMLVIESHMMQWHLPNSPVTPTSRYPVSPHSHPPTPTWPPIPPPDGAFHQTPHLATHHFMNPNSVTLSPPPSVDSQASSPPQAQEQQSHHTQPPNVTCNPTSIINNNNNNSNSSSSNNNSNNNSNGTMNNTSSISTAALTAVAANTYNSNRSSAANVSNHQSDSEEESYAEAVTTTNNVPANYSVQNYAASQQYNNSPPTTPTSKDISHSLKQQIKNSFVSNWSQQQQQQQQQQQAQQVQQVQQQQYLNHNQAPRTQTCVGVSATGGGGGVSNSGGAVIGSGSISAPTTPSYMQPVKREFFPDKNSDSRYIQPMKREFFPENSEPNTNGRLLWDFLQQLLNDRNQKYSDLIAWKCRDTGVFKIVDPAGLAKLWGIQKNHLSMNYDKMSRALRYYYRVNILRKVQGERHCYQFLRNPTELKNIKNISLLRQSVANSSTNAGGSNSTANNSVTNSTNSVTVAAQASSPNNWAIPTQNSLQHASGVQQQTAQRVPPSGASNHLNLPNGISTAAAVAAAAAAAYGPPPSSPLFMHAINGAFHYLSSNGALPPPSSPATLPNTPSNDKFQFNILKTEHSSSVSSPDITSIAEELKPTDLSLNGNSNNNNNNSNNNNSNNKTSSSNTTGTNSNSTEKRPYSSPSANDDGYPLIRNADGLTTIKLIRYNDSETSGNESSQTPPSQNTSSTPMESETSSSICDNSSAMHIDSSTTIDGNTPTDLRK